MKQILSLFLALTLALSLFSLPALAADPDEAEQAAWTLYHLGLFKGTAEDERGFPDFSLDRVPTRAEGVTMLVRLLGKEETAQKGTWKTPFPDVPEWAEPYVGYAYDQKLTNGVGDDLFAPDIPISAAEYLTLVLRALGYTSGEDFEWSQAWNKSDELGFTGGKYGPQTQTFDRGDVAWISQRALDGKLKSNSRQTLRQLLEKQGIKSDADQCLWTETMHACQKGQMVFSISARRDSPRTYSKFVVDAAWANGVPCQITQYSTNRTTTTQLKRLPKDVREQVDEDAFALVYLTYDEDAVLAAATDTVRDNGQTYPVVKLQFKTTGTLPGRPAVKELAEMEYYILSYFGSEFNTK